MLNNGFNAAEENRVQGSNPIAPRSSPPRSLRRISSPSSSTKQGAGTWEARMGYHDEDGSESRLLLEQVRDVHLAKTKSI